MKYVYIPAALLVVVVVGFATIKKVSPVSWGWWGTTNTSDSVALKGFDPVTYFEESEPAMGSALYTFEWADATWQFANKGNRDRFSENPDEYAPRLGSFCAFAVSKGFTADADPEAWHIADGRLYVFADKNVRDQWVAELDRGSLEASNRNWAKR